MKIEKSFLYYSISRYYIKSIIIFILINSSCNENKYENFEIILDNNLGIVTIGLPPSFDTFRTSFHQSDCGCCCNRKIYSFRSKMLDDLPIFDTTSFFQNVTMDDSLKVFVFNISHAACSDCNDGAEKVKEENLDHCINALLTENPNHDILIQEIRKINGLPFSIIGSRVWIDGFVIENLNAETYFNEELISFTAQRRNANKSDFIKDMNKTINSIKINNSAAVKK